MQLEYIIPDLGDRAGAVRVLEKNEGLDSTSLSAGSDIVLSNEEKILEYQRTGSPGLREELILDNLRLVLYIFNRMKVKLPTAMDEEDCFFLGVEGLIRCIDHFDVTKGHFITFAYPRITGAILDGITDFSWMRRSDQRIFYSYMASKDRCALRLGYEPSEGEVAEEMGVYGSQRVRAMTVMHNAYPISLDEKRFVNDEDEELAAPEKEFFGEEEMSTLHRLVEELPFQEREIIKEQFFRDVTFRGSASWLSSSPSTLRRVAQSGLAKLKEGMLKEMGEL